MRILYVGQVGHGQTCRDRMIALQDLGHDINVFDTTPYLEALPRWQRSIAHRFNVGERLKQLNSALRARARLSGTTDCVWIDKGKWIFPDTLELLRRATKGLLVHYTPDPQLCLHRSRYFRAAISIYDVVITTKQFEIETYKNLGAQRIILTGQAYDERRVEKSCRLAAYASDVSFIGHAERWYRRTLRVIGKSENINLKVWGGGWAHRWYGSGLPICGNGLYGADYIAGLKSANIGLGLLSKRIEETSTTRSFEIPACGTFLLAERTDEHQHFFYEGKEAEFFSGPEELVEKVHFYLKSDRVRKKVAAAGSVRCRESGYGNRERLSRVMHWIKNNDANFVDQRYGRESNQHRAVV